jgi:hypothetical protein
MLTFLSSLQTHIALLSPFKLSPCRECYGSRLYLGLSTCMRLFVWSKSVSEIASTGEAGDVMWHWIPQAVHGVHFHRTWCTKHVIKQDCVWSGFQRLAHWTRRHDTYNHARACKYKHTNTRAHASTNKHTHTNTLTSMHWHVQAQTLINMRTHTIGAGFI